MNLAQKYKDVLRGVAPSLTDEFDQLLARINFIWGKGHNPQNGQHLNLTFDASTETQTTVGAPGGATALPATPTGYLVLTIAATEVVVPYYAKE